MRRKNSYINRAPSTEFSASARRPTLGWSASPLWIVTVCLAAVAILGLAGAVVPAYAGTINVNSTLQRGSGTTGVCTIGAAIIAANTNANVDGCTGATASPNTIMVPAGTYTLTVVDNNFGLPFGLPGIQSDITITGLLAPDVPAGAIIERSLANGTPNFGIFDNRQNTGHLTLNNLTIRNGHQASDGAAIFNNGGPTSGGPAALTVNNCTFANNVSTAAGVLGGGGAVGGGGTFSGVTFTNNSATAGGAVEGTSVVTNSFFSNNSAGGGGGGALHCVQGGCSLTISDSTFMNNSESGNGGGAVRSVGGSITRSAFIGNMNTNVNASGGAAGVFGGTITDSLFMNNSSSGDGGAVDIGNNAVTISGSTFQGNTANGRGGALLGGVGTIINSTFSGNTAAVDGGAIQSQNGLTLNNVTITNNTATNGVGGGIAGGADIIRNSIIAGNTNGSGTTPDCSGSLTSQGHNIIGASDSCTINAVNSDFTGTLSLPVDPVVGVLAANSGKTVGSGGNTSVIPTAALLKGSPALDFGSPAAPGSGGTACEATDERGVNRPIGPACDSGAYEAQSGGETSTYDLSVTNTPSSATITLGSNLTYTIKVSNSPSDTAMGPSLTGAINPSNFVSISAPGWGCKTPLVGATGGFICVRGSLASNSSSTISLVVTPTAVGSLSNTATITSTGNDTNPANDSATATVNVVGQAADMAVTMTASASTVLVGNNVTYTATVKNNGPGPATNVALTYTLPANVTLFAANIPAGVSCNLPAATIICTLGSPLSSGASFTIAFILIPQAGAVPSITNTMTVSATEPDPDNTNNSASVTTTVTPVADLAVTKTSSPTSVPIGGNITYTIKVTNNGPSPANGVTATDTLPPAIAFVFVSASASQGSCPPPASGKIVCAVGTLASGASATATVVITPSAAAMPSITNSVNVTSNQFDPNLSNNSASATTTVTPLTASDFSLAISPVSASVQAGGTATYTITVTPSGGFTGNISLACSGAPALTNCSITPSTLAVTNANPVTATMTLQTSAPVVTAGITPAPGGWRGRPNLGREAGLAYFLGSLVSIFVACRLSQRRKVAVPAFVVLALLLVFSSGCGGSAHHAGTTGGTPSGTYQITVTATSGMLSHSGSVALTVQ